MGTKSEKKKKKKTKQTNKQQQQQQRRIDQIIAKVIVWGQLELLEILGETNTLRLKWKSRAKNTYQHVQS